MLLLLLLSVTLTEWLLDDFDPFWVKLSLHWFLYIWTSPGFPIAALKPGSNVDLLRANTLVPPPPPEPSGAVGRDI